MQSLQTLTYAAAAAIGALIVVSPAAAEVVPITQAEFDQQIVGKSMHAVPLSDARQTFVVQLQEGGRAVVSSSFNDVGRWRPYEVAGYCVLWNKLGPPERCYRVARADGKLSTVDPAGKVTATFDMR